MVESAVSGAKEYQFVQDDFRYVDIYFGSLHFSGMEIVYLEKMPLWAMTYSGGMIRHMGRAENVYMFLRQALSLPDAEIPVRGPKHFTAGKYTYNLSTNGTIGRFSGREIIEDDAEEVYSLDFSGGFLN